MSERKFYQKVTSKDDLKLTEKVIERLFAAYFTDNKELADRDLLIRIGTECGLDADEIKDVLETDQYQTEVILDEREASRYGIHAVPFFAVGQYGISGAQSREGMKAAIAKALEEQEAEILQAGSGMTCGPEGCRIG